MDGTVPLRLRPARRALAQPQRATVAAVRRDRGARGGRVRRATASPGERGSVRRAARALRRRNRAAAMTRTASCAVLLAATVCAAPAVAHRLSPAYFGLTETAPGTFDVQWK